jgi:hypothetical protein
MFIIELKGNVLLWQHRTTIMTAEGNKKMAEKMNGCEN